MRRREFIQLLGGALAWPLAARAQQPTKVFRIGFLDPDFASNQEVYNERFRAGLRAFGYLEGKNIIIEFRYAEGNHERLSALAAELVHLGVDVLVTYSNPGVLAAKQATTTIPIVMIRSGDAVASGLVASLNRPGGIVTGQSFFHQLPVEQPNKFKFVINLKTAKALGLTIPETLLATADEVIQ